MSYEVIEAALASQLREIANLTVSLNDATKIQGGSQKVAILRYDRFEQTRIGMGGEHEINWRIEIQLYARYTNDADTRDRIRELRDAIITRLNRYPNLGRPEVFDSMVVSGESIPEAVQLGGYAYLGEHLTAEVIEQLSVSYAE